MTDNTHTTTGTTTESGEDFTTSEGLRILLHRLHATEPNAWEHDATAAELMAFACEKYAPLARKHGLDVLGHDVGDSRLIGGRPSQAVCGRA